MKQTRKKIYFPIFLFLFSLLLLITLMWYAGDSLFRRSPENTKKEEEQLSHPHTSQKTSNENPSENTSAEETKKTYGNRMTYAEGFFFETISPEIEQRISGKSYPKGCTYPLENLRYVKVKYYDFDGRVQSGELIVNTLIAQDIVEIFKELYDAKYPIEKIRLIDEYNASDDASMADNNSSAFNYRCVDGTSTLSNHSYGLAVDINPLYNPYVRTGFGDRDVLPVNGADYADREKDFPHKITKGDVCYNAFVSRGFLWGGEWDNPVDYQHFYKEP